eukprot:CAMPEP_0197629462 /NCGR_PEP_ID=MMETSP1338-20131121/7298_1 /TAXON_ID=43686 ORGANISM="Pelagodinium beii, Strain RCC1491" /NCGR_SAMPLE_ID=MMETSP1338 /ASSEMBLY_ACC=CAM_ASM_000754 /LENGTH=832 /DNA_ID=CAMNT_0043200501 /DNA_START=18 /DNA_END=2516 /DNA_ORIENTATION=+
MASELRQAGSTGESSPSIVEPEGKDADVPHEPVPTMDLPGSLPQKSPKVARTISGASGISGILKADDYVSSFHLTNRKKLDDSTTSSAESNELRQYPDVRWQWKHKSGWKDYDDRSSFKIEYAYRNGETKIRVQTGKKGSTPMEIFFEDLIQHDPITGNTRRVQRTGPEYMRTRIMRYCRGLYRMMLTGRPQYEFFADYQQRRLKLSQCIDEKEDEFDVSTLYNSGVAATIVLSPLFFGGSMIIVLLNAAWLAVDTEYNDASSISSSSPEFQAVEHTFCAIFTMEILIRYAAFKGTRLCLQDSWFLFDLLLVTIMVLETWLIPIVLKILNDDSAEEALRHFTILRMLRLLRLTRIARLVRAVPEIMTLIKGIGAAMRGVASTVFLLFVILFIFAIIFKDQARNHEELREELFPTVWWSMWSLLMFATFLDGPAAIYTQIQRGMGRHMALLFLVVIFISAFTVLNMLIGILCEVVTAVSESEKEEAHIAYLKNHLLDILECYDINDDNTIRKHEFDLLMRNLEFREAINNFGADFQDLQTLAEVLFVKNNSDILSFQQLLSVVLRLKGGNAAQVMDVVDLREYVKQRTDHLEECITHLARPHADTAGKKVDRPEKTSSEEVSPKPLLVKIIGARQLRDADTLPGQGLSDAYCTCMIVGKPETTVQTRVIPNNLNPVWDESFYLRDYCPGDYLRFHVYDQDNSRLKKDDSLGSVTAPSEKIEPDGFQGELLLGHAGRNIEAYLSVEITPAVMEEQVPGSPVLSMVNGGSPQNATEESPGHAETLMAMLARLDELCSGQRELRSELTVITQRLENVERSLADPLGGSHTLTTEEA